MDKPKNYAESASITRKLKDLYTQVVTGYREEKKGQNDLVNECWDIYNCKLTDAQGYEGDSQIFEPIVRDAVEARRKRFTAMLFPAVGNNIQCVSETGDIPAETLAILQRHVVYSDMRAVLSQMLLAGDIEGQWSLMASWRDVARKITRKFRSEFEGEEIIDVKEEEIRDCGPQVRVLPAQDLWVFPDTSKKIDDCEIVAVALRLTDEDLDEMVDQGLMTQKGIDRIVKDAGDDQIKWADKNRSSDAGIKMKKGQKFCLVYMVFKTLKLEGEKVPAIVFFGGPDNVVGVVKNPYWSGRVPVISAPVDQVPGSFWGKSKVGPVRALAYQLNDITNMGMDSAEYSLLPIVMTDPVKNPRTGSMVMGKAAIWETSPNDTSLLNFPQLYTHALTLRQVVKQQIMESMDVNETMLGKAPQGRKNAQAIAAQSSEALATIGDVARRVEHEILNPLLEWFYELDVQFRDDDLWVAMEGEHGVQAKMQRLPAQQVNERYHFRWMGLDQTIGAQRIQQMIGMMNVLRGVPPQQLNGRRLDVGPILDFVAQSTFGPTMTQNILIDERHKTLVPPAVEIELLLNGFDCPPNPLDNQIEHLQALQKAAQQTGDPKGVFRKQMQARMQMMQAQMPQGTPGMGGMGGPGQPGQPRPGAMPGQGRPAQNPAGAIHADHMQDPQAQPRG
jgi:hypothetical protein